MKVKLTLNSGHFDSFGFSAEGILMSASEIPPPSTPLHGPFRTEIVSDPHTYYAARLDQTERERMEMETSYRVLEMQKRTAEGKRNIQLCRISY